MKQLLFVAVSLAMPALAFASTEPSTAIVDLSNTVYGYLGIALFVAAYILVPLENKIHLRKSKPLMFAAGVIWLLLGLAYYRIGDLHTAHAAIKNNLLEFAEIFLFLLAAMTYINALEERNVFQALRAFLVSRGFSLRSIFWITGLLAFFISPVADNLTTALIMGAVAMAVGGKNTKFVALACINIVVAANAGGAFSPFGDITTLMVWTKGKAEFHEFFRLFLPSLVHWLVPALLMSFAVGKEPPEEHQEDVKLKYGAFGIMFLFLATITTAVCFHNFLNLPPGAGMMLGLGYLGLFSYHIKLHEGNLKRFDYILGTRSEETFTPLRAIAMSKKPIGDIIEKFDEAIFAIDTNHKITHWNKVMEKLTGIKAADAVGTNRQWSPFYKEQRPSLADLCISYLPEDAIATHYEAGMRRKNPYVEDAYDASGFYPHMGEEGRWLSLSAAPIKDRDGKVIGAVEILQDFTERRKQAHHFDIMQKVARAEWDTLMFFYGVILCVGGLAQFGYLASVSTLMYHDLGATTANVLVGGIGAVLGNIPILFAVLAMDPVMSHGQWLLLTLTVGIGGNLLSVGSAAGVALMGTARGKYTFGVHLKWVPAIILGYVASIWCHLILNAKLM
ncbi:MAG: sodium:proton antiporter NhaD [Deltaproteobacteria bacterium]|nr:sodium:proton antiporter NhaD [Deltaproteobacteria bacterium]